MRGVETLVSWVTSPYLNIVTANSFFTLSPIILVSSRRAFWCSWPSSRECLVADAMVASCDLGSSFAACTGTLFCGGSIDYPTKGYYSVTSWQHLLSLASVHVRLTMRPSFSSSQFDPSQFLLVESIDMWCAKLLEMTLIFWTIRRS